MENPTKVYKVTLMIVDANNDYDYENGTQDLCAAIENLRPCYPTVMDFDSREVDWSDEHPLNLISKQDEEFERLFSEACWRLKL